MVCGLTVTMGPHEHMSYAIGGRWLLRPHHSFDRQRRVLGPTGAAREAFERWVVEVVIRVELCNTLCTTAYPNPHAYSAYPVGLHPNTQEYADTAY